MLIQPIKITLILTDRNLHMTPEASKSSRSKWSEVKSSNLHLFKRSCVTRGLNVSVSVNTAWGRLLVRLQNSSVSVNIPIYLFFGVLFPPLSFCVCHRENPHSPMNSFHLIFSGLLDLDPSACFPGLWIYYKDTKEKLFLFWGEDTGLAGTRREDKTGWGRPGYYHRTAVLFISRFLGEIKLK